MHPSALASSTLRVRLQREDLVDLSIEELERISKLVDAEFATRKRQKIEDFEANTLALEQQKQVSPEFDPKMERVLSGKRIDLNIGGKHFATNLDNLRRIPGTFFAVLFAGRWELKVDPKDGSIFIDRNPVMFGVILDYFRTGKVDLTGLGEFQLKTLYDEAEFYQIPALMRPVVKPAFNFSPQFKGPAQFSQDRSTAMSNQIGENAYAISATPFSPGKTEKKIRVVKGKRFLIGVASRAILEKRSSWQNCGWYVSGVDGSMCGQQQRGVHRPFRGKRIEEGSIVTVKLDCDLNISFAVDGVDWGVAFKSVAKDHSIPLHLAVELDYLASAKDTLQEGIVELL